MLLRVITGRLVVCVLMGLVLTAGACTPGDSSDDELPEPEMLLDSAADSVRDVSSTRFAMNTTGHVPGLTVTGIEGELTTEGGPYGAAQGSATMSMAGQLVESEFVLEGDSLYLESPAGGFQEVPAEQITDIYDPSAVLDPERGITNLLTTVRSPETTGTETVNGTETHVVSGSIAQETVTDLLPGVESDAEVTMWLAADEGDMPVKTTFTFPDEGDEGEDTPTVDVTLSDMHEPVTVSPPE